MLQAVPSYRHGFASIPIRILLAVLLIASGPTIQIGKAVAVNFSLFGYLSSIALPSLLKSSMVDAALKPTEQYLEEHPGILDYWSEEEAFAGFQDSGGDEMLNDLSTTLSYDEVHISMDEMSVLNDLHWRSIESSQRVDIAWDLIAEGCARYLIQAGTMPSSWTEYLDNEIAQKRMYAPHFVVGRRPSLIKLCLIILPPPDVPNIISGGIVPFGGYPRKDSGRYRQSRDHRGPGLNVDEEIVSAVSKIVELSWYNYEETMNYDEINNPLNMKTSSKKKKNKKKKKDKKAKSPELTSGSDISDEGEGGGGVIGDAIEELLLRNIQEWLFVEEQLLDPTVVVDTPEILLPLQHLTSSLEMIAHYYLMRGLKHKAIETLERACPLMELIPIEVEADQHRACFELLTSIYFNRFEENSVIKVMPKPSPLNWAFGNEQKGAGVESSEVDMQINDYSHPTPPPILDHEQGNEMIHGYQQPDMSTSDITRRLESIRVPFEHLRRKMSMALAEASLHGDVHGGYMEDAYGNQMEIPNAPYEEMNIDEMTSAFAMSTPTPQVSSSSYEASLSAESLKKLPSSIAYSDYDALLIQMAEREHLHQEKVKNKKFLSEQLKHRDTEDESRVFHSGPVSSPEVVRQDVSPLSNVPSSEFDLLAVKFVRALLADGAGPSFPPGYFTRNDSSTSAQVSPLKMAESSSPSLMSEDSMKRRNTAIESASIILRLAEETVTKLGQTAEGAERCYARMCGEYLTLMRKLLETEQAGVGMAVRKDKAEARNPTKHRLREISVREVSSLQPLLLEYQVRFNGEEPYSSTVQQHASLFSMIRPSVIVANDEVEVLERLKMLELQLVNSTEILKGVQQKTSDNELEMLLDTVSEIEERLKIATVFVQAVDTTTHSQLLNGGRRRKKKRNHVLASIIDEHEEHWNQHKFSGETEDVFGALHAAAVSSEGEGKGNDEDIYVNNDQSNHIQEELPFVSTFDRPRSVGYLSSMYGKLCVAVDLDPIHSCHLPQLIVALRDKILLKLTNPFSKELKLKSSTSDDDGVNYLEFVFYYLVLIVWRVVSVCILTEVLGVSSQFLWFMMISSVASVFLTMRRDFVQAMQPNNESLPSTAASMKRKNNDKKRRGGASTLASVNTASGSSHTDKEYESFNENQFHFLGHEVNGTNFGLREDWSMPNFYWLVCRFYCSLCRYVGCEFMIPEFTLFHKVMSLFEKPEQMPPVPSYVPLHTSEEDIVKRLASPGKPVTLSSKHVKTRSKTGGNMEVLSQIKKQVTTEDLEGDDDSDDSDEDLSNLVKSITGRATQASNKTKKISQKAKANQEKRTTPVPSPESSETGSTEGKQPLNAGGSGGDWQAKPACANNKLSAKSTFERTFKQVHTSDQPTVASKPARTTADYGGKKNNIAYTQSTHLNGGGRKLNTGKGYDTSTRMGASHIGSRLSVDDDMVPPRESYSGGWATIPESNSTSTIQGASAGVSSTSTSTSLMQTSTEQTSTTSLSPSLLSSLSSHQPTSIMQSLNGTSNEMISSLTMANPNDLLSLRSSDQSSGTKNDVDTVKADGNRRTEHPQSRLPSAGEDLDLWSDLASAINDNAFIPSIAGNTSTPPLSTSSTPSRNPTLASSGNSAASSTRSSPRLSYSSSPMRRSNMNSVDSTLPSLSLNDSNASSSLSNRQDSSSEFNLPFDNLGLFGAMHDTSGLDNMPPGLSNSPKPSTNSRNLPPIGLPPGLGLNTATSVEDREPSNHDSHGASFLNVIQGDDADLDLEEVLTSSSGLDGILPTSNPTRRSRRNFVIEGNENDEP